MSNNSGSNFTLVPIGRIHKTDGGEIYIGLEDAYWPGTLNLDTFSHIIVLWWITGRDNRSDRDTLVVTPPSQNGAPRSGVFACRSPSRPNPIGHTIVAILEIDHAEHRIRVDHMDAFDGTPVVDIKPYLPSSDRVDNAVVPAWLQHLEPRYTTMS